MTIGVLVVKLCVLGSGSKGNSVYLDINGFEILIDAGFSFKELKKRLGIINKDIFNIKTILVSHDHEDHIKAIPQFKKRTQAIIVYPGAKSPYFNIPQYIEITSFKLSHDSPCYGFRIQSGSFVLCYVNDTGCIPESAMKYFFGATVMLLEFNYDLKILTENQKYPTELVERIASDVGHMDNTESSRILSEATHDGLKLVVPMHLSEHNNNPELALYEASKYIDTTICEVVCARQDKPSKMFFFME